MPATAPVLAAATAAKLAALGQRIRAVRKAHKITAASAAEAAGMSRVTLHRIERGEPSVTFGAYLSVLAALGLDLAVVEPGAAAPGRAASPQHKGWIPARIRLADYPQLKRVAWQVHGVDEVAPAEAFGLYERNARHLDTKAMDAQERELLSALRLAFGETSRAGV
jgi:transcriptional regulator with XRE-family HTH domain